MQQNPLDVALSVSHPELVGPLDEEERLLLCDSAYDLVLIENATELFRQLMMSGKVLEIVLDNVVRSSTNCYVMPSETFHVEDNRLYPFQVQQYQNIYLERMTHSPVPTCVIALVGLELQGEGHYGVLWYNVGTNVVEIFDSMEDNLKGGHYSADFRRLARDIFNTRRFTHPACVSLTFAGSLQLTGGFPGIETAPLKQATKRNVQVEEKLENIIVSQSTETQNHFCYMWAIWYIHLRLLGLNISQVINQITGLRIDPLFVIKRYIYNLITVLGLKQFITYPAFFERHFPSVWTNAVNEPMNSLNRLNPQFHRYRLDIRPADNIRDCLIFSILPQGVTGESNTTVPPVIQRKYCPQTVQPISKRRRLPKV